MSELKLNILPTPTWNWLRMNDTDYQMKKTDGYGSPSIVTTAGVSESDGIFPAEFDGGIGPDFSKRLDEDQVHAEVFDINADTTDPLKIAFDYDEEKGRPNNAEFLKNMAKRLKL